MGLEAIEVAVAALLEGMADAARVPVDNFKNSFRLNVEGGVARVIGVTPKYRTNSLLYLVILLDTAP